MEIPVFNDYALALARRTLSLGRRIHLLNIIKHFARSADYMKNQYLYISSG